MIPFQKTELTFGRIPGIILILKVYSKSIVERGKTVGWNRKEENKTKWWLLVAAQILIIGFTVWSVGYMFLFSGSGNMAVRRYTIFRYFTVDSNILCAVSSACLLVQALRGRWAGSKGVMLFRYVGTAAVTVTLMTVLLFLGPVYGYAHMFSRWNLWLHLAGPLLAILSFLWLERDGAFPEKKHLILSLLPVIVYGAVYFIMAVVIGEGKGWPDFYGFNRGGTWYISYAAMTAGTALIGFVLGKLRSIGCGKE